jgi:hypothetical protein
MLPSPASVIAKAVSAVPEPDVVRVVDDRLYALSSATGLSVVDLSSPDDLRLLGRLFTTARPFELYLRDGIAYALFVPFYRYLYDDAIGQIEHLESSRLVAIDVRDPAAMLPSATLICRQQLRPHA